MKGGSFPYSEPVDEVEELSSEDEDIVKKVVKKMQGNADNSDYLSSRSADHFAFAGGNRRVGIANETAGKGMVPFPAMYKKRIQVGGGVNGPAAYTPGSSVKTGTEYGWANAPVPPKGSTAEITFSELEAGEDPSLVKLRKVISGILRQEKENE